MILVYSVKYVLRGAVRHVPNVFQYHAGCRHQVQSWPTNPVSRYISDLSKYPPKTIIADLGCGDAALARALLAEDLIVLSYDLVSDNHLVVAADICACIPLPGSEGPDETPGGQIVDVAVFALSLMGTNWVNSVREAWRILKPGYEILTLAANVEFPLISYQGRTKDCRSGQPFCEYGRIRQFGQCHRL
jgi:ribosomal RNA-processing protein 8